MGVLSTAVNRVYDAGEAISPPRSTQRSASAPPWMLLAWRPVRVGPPIMATVVLIVLLGLAGGAEPAQRAAAPPQTTSAPRDALDTYLVLTRRALALRNDRRLAEIALATSRRALARSERRLGARLRALYEVGSPDAVEVLLGAESLDDALSELEGLQRIAHDEAEQVEELRRTRRELAGLVQRLRLREAQAAALRAEAARVVRSLARAGPRRASLPGDEPAPSDQRAGAGRQLTVVASGYALEGLTASGLPAGVGTVAVDPAVIPLGAALTIPGYGGGVAADTGAAVRGAAIDLWFETEAEALTWGRRVVTITVAPR
jgi:3D (Asp-Asp-Asp) domain-containing protein